MNRLHVLLFFLLGMGCTTPKAPAVEEDAHASEQDGGVDVGLLPTYPLVVTLGSGDGTGAVAIAGDERLQCPGECEVQVQVGETITLVATPGLGSAFSGWSGVCEGTDSCTLTITGPTEVTATFRRLTFEVAVTAAGTGAGSVFSDDGQVQCGETCVGEYRYGEEVTLHATPDGGARFASWEGSACSGAVDSTCTFTVTAATSLTATFELDGGYLLSVLKTGAGVGTVASLPIGIQCGTDCTASFARDATVVLTATAETGSTFTSWSGACTGADATCTVQMDQAHAVTAAFDIQTRTLAVESSGSGGGSFSSDPGGIACGDACEAEFLYGQSVTLTAEPNAYSSFSSWGADCEGAVGPSCTLEMTTERTARAIFTLNTYNVTVAKSGSGSGTVSTDVGALNCGATCSAAYAHGTEVTLTASPDRNSTFVGWTGACSGTSQTCTVTVAASVSVTATFAEVTHELTITKGGSGAGVVATSEETLCGSDCTFLARSYGAGERVTLLATASVGSTFVAWSGACTGTTSCIVTMTEAQSVTATFAVATHRLSVTAPIGGSVDSSGGAIRCGGTCSASYDYGRTVELTATAARGYSFVSWGGACAGSATTCSLDMTADRAVTATFAIQSYSLAVTKSVAAGGTVSASAAIPPLSCGPSCASTSQVYAYNTTVSLTATAASGYTFAGWGGDCSSYGTASTCSLAVDSAKTVSATFVIGTNVLTVNKTGSGTVTSSPSGINCGATCGAAYSIGQIVTLTATPSVGSTFSEWSGGGCSGAATTCAVTMDTAKTVAARFSPTQHTVTVTKSGSGSGTITADSGAISCGSTCSSSYEYGTTVTLTASGSTGSTFTGWSGAGCSGTSSCVLNMTAARAVVATFVLDSYPLRVSIAGTGSGSVTAMTADPAINCTSGTCSSSYVHGTSVTLTATAATGSSFVGWSGACSGSAATCAVAMTAAANVSATFLLSSYTVSFTKTGTGVGTVSSNEDTPSVSCGTSCALTSASYLYGSSVTLSATASAGSSFGGWAGDGTCTGSSAACTFSVTGNKSVSAAFALVPRALSVSKTGNGTITAVRTGVAETPTISCGSTCTANYDHGTSVTLTSTPASDSLFTSWGGACAGSLNTCTVSMTEARAVTATFSLKTYSLAVAFAGTGTGTIHSVTPASPSIACTSGICSATYTHGTTVSLQATPDAASSSFTNWSACTGSTTATTCDVLMDGAKSITAQFTLSTRTLTVTAPTGGSIETVGSSDIACGVSCSRGYAHGASVTLQAIPTSNAFEFQSWTGACSSDLDDTCVLSMTAARTVGASFRALPGRTVGSLGVSSTVCNETDVARVRGTVTVGADCTLEVGAGLVVEGTLTGAAGSSIHIEAGSLGIVLAPAAVLSNVSVESEGVFGVAILSADDAVVENVTVAATRGMGLYAEDSDRVSLTNLSLTGPVTTENAGDPGWALVQGAPSTPSTCAECDCDPGDIDEMGGLVCTSTGQWATWTAVTGLYALNSDLVITTATVSGFAAYGVALEDSSVTADLLTTTNNIGVGLRADNSLVTVAGLTASDTYDTLIASIGVPLSIGVILESGASLNVLDFASIHDNLNGLVSSNATLAAQDLTVSYNDTGAWFGSGSELYLNGSQLSHNTVVGLRLNNAGTTELLDVSIADNVRGLEIIASTDVSLFTCDIASNGVFGVLAGRTSAVLPSFSDVSISGTGGAYGLLIGVVLDPGTVGGFAPNGGSPAGVVVSGDAAGNDDSPPATMSYNSASFPVDLASIIGPSYLAGPTSIVGPMF